MNINGRKTAFINVHLDHRLKNPASVRKIMSYVNENSDPVVLIGDFNMGPRDSRWEEIKGTSADWIRAQDESRITNRYFIDTAKVVTPGAKEARDFGTGFGRIDYVLVEEKYFNIIDAGLVRREHRLSSDHIAYFARLSPKP